MRQRVAFHIKAQFTPRGCLQVFLLKQSSHTASCLHGRDQKAAPGRVVRAGQAEGSSRLSVRGGEHVGIRQKSPVSELPGSWAQSHHSDLVPPPN